MSKEKEGRWITVNGRHVFLGEGESVGDAIKNSKKPLSVPKKKKGESAASWAERYNKEADKYNREVSSKQAKTEEYTLHGSKIKAYVADNADDAVNAVRKGTFQKFDDRELGVRSKTKPDPGTIKHIDEEAIAVRVGKNHYSAVVSHRQLQNGEEYYSVEMSPRTADAIGAQFTRGKSNTRSGYLAKNRKEARQLARKAVEYEVSGGKTRRK